MTTEYIKIDSTDNFDIYAVTFGNGVDDDHNITVAPSEEPGDVGDLTNKTVGEWREIDDENEKERVAEIYAPTREWGETADTQTDRGLAGHINTEKQDDGEL